MRITMRFFLLMLFFSGTFQGIAQSDEYYGVASFYSDEFHGRKTASGEVYNKNKFTAAHKSLPFGTTIRVTRIDNKQSVKVRINDRGPYIKGRIVDLSRVAAERLGILKDGNANVKIEVLGKNVATDDATTAAPPKKTAPTVEKEKPTQTTKEYDNKSVGLPPKVVKSVDDVVVKPKEKKAAPAPKKEVKAPAPKNIASEMPATRVRGRDYRDYDLYKVQILRPERQGYGVQVASLTNYENVMKQVAQLQEKWFNNVLVSVEPGKGKPIYKILLGPFPDMATAKSYKSQLKRKKKITGFIVDLSTLKY